MSLVVFYKIRTFVLLSLSIQVLLCEGSPCTSEQFECRSTSTCISLNQFCDGNIDCSDASDEPWKSNSATYQHNTTFCKTTSKNICVLPSSLIPRKEKICYKNSACSDDEFECNDGSQCIDLKYFCDTTIYHCRDFSDRPLRSSSVEYNTNPSFCKTTKGNICVLPPHLLSRKNRICQKHDLCEEDEFECNDGSQCIPLKNFCDGKAYQCRDFSDEPLRSSDVEYPSHARFCKSFDGDICVLPPRLQSRKDKICQENSACSENEFECTDGSQCIALSNFCDGDTSHCRDSSDENLRNTSANYDKNATFCKTMEGGICILPPRLHSKKDEICQNDIECSDYEFECNDGSRCIPLGNFCDGKTYQCRDLSDEPLRKSTVDYSSNTKFCKTFDGDICVLPSRLHSRKNRICQNSSTCTDEEFECDDGSRCNALNEFCDGMFANCRDSSDEKHLEDTEIAPESNTSYCYSLFEQKCALPSTISDTKKICAENGGCRKDLFKCDKTSQCFSLWQFCDNQRDCRDGSDEQLRDRSSDNRTDEAFCILAGFSFRGICALPMSLILRKSEICRENTTCNNFEFECADGSKCIAKSQFCDGKPQCRDHSDELYRNSSMDYGVNIKLCRPLSPVSTQVCILPENMISRKEDLCRESYKCSEDEFECKDGSGCVKMSVFCDGINDCRDGSDEYKSLTYSEGRMCKVKAFSCDLPKTYHCNKVHDCDDGVDECLCGSVSSQYFSSQNCFRCLSYPSNVIDVAKLCDGVIDCQDLSDECICDPSNRIDICSKLDLQFQKIASTTCQSGSDQSDKIPLESICDGRADCDDLTDELYCRLTETIKGMNRTDRFECENGQVGVKCDGTPDCPNFEDEECSDCTDPSEFCKYVSHYDSANGYFRCKKKFTGIFRVRKLCNGEIECPDGGDELGCSNRFYCTNDTIPSIDISGKCNKIDECENKRDEEDCDHFQCKDDGKVKYVDENKVCNGVSDCFNGSDECVKGCIKSAFSDEESMITSKGFMAFIWIFGPGALIGCIAVAYKEVRAIHAGTHIKQVRTKRSSKIYKVLIISLSFSDLLVAIYVIAICIKSLQFKENYCEYDRAWRSSSACSALGAILIIGSEQSVLTMALLTTFRLVTVIRPLKLLNTKFVWITLGVTWIISIILGIIPTISSNEDYFVDEITFDNWPLYSSVNNSEVKYLNQWLSLMHNESTLEEYNGLTDWSKLEKLVSDLNPNYTVVYKFGYYSTHTVCLPTLFPDTKKDIAWGYSLLLLFINFSIFFYIMIAYIILHRRLARPNPAVSSSTKNPSEANKRRQIKLTIIVLTDFFCWMPVCVMGFLQILGVDIPNDAYLPTGLLIIPINSALNPFIYSGLSDVLWEKTEYVRNRCRKLHHRTKETLTTMVILRHQEANASTNDDHVIEETEPLREPTM